MRKSTLILSAVLAAAWVSAEASTATIGTGQAVDIDDVTVPAPQISREPLPVSEAKAKTQSAARPAAASPYHASAVKSITSTSDLAGEYVLSYESYSSYDGGNLVTISAVEGTDSILIDNFYGYPVKAQVDISAMAITIPATYLYTSSFGDVYLTYFDSDQVAYSTAYNVTGTISSDGNITINTGWGAIVTAGTYAGRYYGLYVAGSTIEQVNGTMTYTSYSKTSQTTSTQSVKIVVEQTSDSTVAVKNFYDKGTTIIIDLYPSRTASVDMQYVYYDSTYTTGYYIAGALFSDGYTSMAYYTPLVCNTATDNRTISWGNWSMLMYYNGSWLYSFRGVDCTIQADFDITYPSGTVIPLDGEGTASSPYLITSVSDWNALAQYMSDNNAHMGGLYLKLANDIDATQTALTPLGYDGSVNFCGDLDGDGKTITIAYSESSALSGALIKSAWSGANIHNFTLAGSATMDTTYVGAIAGSLYKGTISDITLSLDITANANYACGTAGYCYMSAIKNCTFTGQMTGTANYTAPIAGFAAYSTISGCVNSGTVSVTGNYVAGIAGYAYQYTIVSDCVNDSAASVTSGANSAGVIGALYTYSEALRCVNYGTVTCSSNYNAGVVAFCSVSCVMADCYNYGTVSSTGSYTGGVASRISSSEMTGCVNYGTITSTKTRVGGLLAYATKSEVSNSGNEGRVIYTGTTASCYVAGAVAAALYGTYTGVYNTGAIEVDTTKSNYVGGVFGQLYSDDAYVITGCYNTADVDGCAYVAGIAPLVSEETSLTMTDCYNTGNITAHSTSKGYAAGLLSYYPIGSSFTGCWNSGDITSSGGTHTAGLFGGRIATNSQDTPISFARCHNTGNVTSTGASTGGLIGALYSTYVDMDSCYNTGTIYSTGTNGYTGGCVGSLINVENVRVSNCWNSGDVWGSGSYLGGIVGGNNHCDTIVNCFNTGNITFLTTGSASARGVAGIAGRGASYFENVYNTGTITGRHRVAGIVGEGSADGEMFINKAYNMGRIALTEDSTSYGGIIGVGTSDTTAFAASNVIENTYYLADSVADGAEPDAFSIAVTRAELAALDLGDGWISGDDYTFPLISTLATIDCARLRAVTIIPADGDTYDNITKDFHVGDVEGVTWTASPSAVEISGTDAKFPESYTGEITLTASCGDEAIATQIYCDVYVAGVTAASVSDDASLVSERLYRLDGTVAGSTGEGFYIVVRTYSDGTTTATKEVR